MAGRRTTSRLPIKTLAIVISLLIVAGIGAYVANSVFSESDPIAKLCTQILPQEKRFGMKGKLIGSSGIEIDLQGLRDTKSGADPAQIEGFLECIRLRLNREPQVVNGVRVPLEPVGQFANRLKRESGTKLTLMPGANDEILQNLRIGPGAGPKETIITDWCSLGKAGACVTCEPDNPATSAVEVIVRLRQNPPVEKKMLPGKVPPPSAGIKLEPWQLVDSEGNRFYYECKKP